jgi:hypothetical protein
MSGKEKTQKIFPKKWKHAQNRQKHSFGFPFLSAIPKNMQSSHHMPLCEDLRSKIAETSPSGINLKTLAQNCGTSPEEMEFITYAIWLNTCGFKAFKTSALEYLSPLQGFAPFLRRDAKTYLALEKCLKGTILQWNPTLKKTTLEWLNPQPKKISTIILKDGTTLFAQKIQPRATIIHLKGCLHTEYNSRILQYQIDPTHPLSYLLSGYENLPDKKIQTNQIEEITPADPQIWQLNQTHILWTLGNTMLET